MWEHGNPTLHNALTYGGAHSALATVIATYDQPGAQIMSVFAARMLLEESARLTWRFAVSGEAAFKSRTTRYFDEFRSRRKKTLHSLTSSGISRADAMAFLAKPKNVISDNPDYHVTPNREPLPGIDRMLRDMGKPYQQPGWLRSLTRC